VLVVVALLVVLAFATTNMMRRTATVPHNGRTVVVDAGHGGRDGGVVGVLTGVKEAEINLLIARQLQRILTERGYRVVMTRTNHDGLYGNATSNRKLADMHARRAIILKESPDLVVSIHQNAYPRSRQRGAQVFYSIGGTPDVAAVVQRQLNAQLPESRRSARPGDYFILNSTPYPSILVECGFLSTPEEEALLVTSAYQEKVAFAIYSGIEMALASKQ
jgi:N-acetylmuramoyl-L-alanine amidase